jgi:hypothetical protein
MIHSFFIHSEAGLARYQWAGTYVCIAVLRARTASGTVLRAEFSFSTPSYLFGTSAT